MEGLVVLVVTDVLVSSSSVVTEICDEVSRDSDCEFVEPQSSSFSKKRLLDWGKSTTDIQEEDDAAHATAELALVN